MPRGLLEGLLIDYPASAFITKETALIATSAPPEVAAIKTDPYYARCELHGGVQNCPACRLKASKFVRPTSATVTPAPDASTNASEPVAVVPATVPPIIELAKKLAENEASIAARESRIADLSARIEAERNLLEKDRQAVVAARSEIQKVLSEE